MTTVTFLGTPFKTVGALPKINSLAPDFALVRKDLSEANLQNFAGKKKILNIFPSLDTKTCALSVKQFYHKAANLKDVVVINISMDLPFAQARFCTQESVNVEVLSAFRSSFPIDYGVQIAEGPIRGLCSRAVVLLDENNKVLYTEQVQEISHEPNYDKVLALV